jgi:hypothetical protein
MFREPNQEGGARLFTVQIQRSWIHNEHRTPKGVRNLELSRTINIALLRSDDRFELGTLSALSRWY